MIFSPLSFAQNSEQQIVLNDVSGIISATESKQYETVMDYFHPAIFELVDRNSMKNSLENMYKGNEEFKMELIPTPKNSLKVSSIRSSKTVENSEYVFVHYSLQFKMISQKEEFYDILGNYSEKATNIQIQISRQGFSSDFIDSRTVLVKTTSMMIGVKDSETQNEWKYIAFGPENGSFLTQILSEEIVNDAENYYYDILSLEKQ